MWAGARPNLQSEKRKCRRGKGRGKKPSQGLKVTSDPSSPHVALQKHAIWTDGSRLPTGGAGGACTFSGPGEERRVIASRGGIGKGQRGAFAWAYGRRRRSHLDRPLTPGGWVRVGFHIDHKVEAYDAEPAAI